MTSSSSTCMGSASCKSLSPLPNRLPVQIIQPRPRGSRVGARQEGRGFVLGSPRVLGPVLGQADTSVGPSLWHQPLFSSHGHPLPHLWTGNQPL